jgi:hypothetical protein
MADMNLDELRDAHAKRLGWEYCKPTPGSDSLPWQNHADDIGRNLHPVPPTLDAIAEMMPPNWEWCMDVDVLEAYRDTTGYVWVERTGDELTDRARLAWLAWEAEAKGAK